MERTKHEIHHEKLKQAILNAAARNFLKYGYTNTTIKRITKEVGISTGSFNNIFQTKEDVLCELVRFVLEQQFSVASELVRGRTEDKILFYAAETVLQLYIVEMDENLRDVYCSAYSLPKSSDMLQQTVTRKLEYVFKEHLPHLETKDFYKLEIASGGIMRGFMTVPCSMWFTIDQKVASFLETTLLLYRIPDEKIQEAIEFVSQIDYPTIARNTIGAILNYLESSKEIL